MRPSDLDLTPPIRSYVVLAGKPSKTTILRDRGDIGDIVRVLKPENNRAWTLSDEEPGSIEDLYVDYEECMSFMALAGGVFWCRVRIFTPNGKLKFAYIMRAFDKLARERFVVTREVKERILEVINEKLGKTGENQ